MDNEIKVSVYCLTYNHVKYIKDTLEGFVKQKTNFRYEVFVHDDASTDGTQDIVKEYALKYPNIIKPILQKENQHSKHVKIIKDILFPMFNGKYVAICEGDDYWISDNKLQIQYDFLEKHNDYSACVHNTNKLIDGIVTSQVFNSSKIDKDLNFRDVILRGSSQFHTSSIMYRKSLMDKEHRPYFTNLIKGVGDYPLSVCLAISGKIYFFKDIMSTYRINVPNSWSNTVESNNESHIRVRKECILMLNEANKYSNYIHDNDFRYAILYHQYDIEKLTYGKIKNKKKYFPLMQGMSFKKKIAFLWKMFSPNTFNFIINIRDKIKNAKS